MKLKTKGFQKYKFKTEKELEKLSLKQLYEELSKINLIKSKLYEKLSVKYIAK